jgi:TPR repeat protein
MVVSMEKPWYRRIFSRPQTPVPDADRPGTNYEDAEVQFGMGLKYANGEGAAQDFAQAAEWYRKAAEQNHSLAQFNLGMMCAQGQGMARDDAQSLNWFRKAARQGDAGAQFNLGMSCHRASFGRTHAEAPQSRIEAYKWYQLAAAQGYKGSEAARATLTLSMSREDVAAGEQQASAFVATQPTQATS